MHLRHGSSSQALYRGLSSPLTATHSHCQFALLWIPGPGSLSIAFGSRGNVSLKFHLPAIFQDEHANMAYQQSRARTRCSHAAFRAAQICPCAQSFLQAGHAVYLSTSDRLRWLVSITLFFLSCRLNCLSTARRPDKKQARRSLPSSLHATRRALLQDCLHE